MVCIYRVSENEGQTENGYKTIKIGGLDHLFGISVIYTSERFYGSRFYEEFLISLTKKCWVKK